jgi:DNA-binding NarL/FixJ family response regulator
MVAIPMTSPDTRRPRLLLADDRPLVREAFQALLAPDFDVVATATDERAIVSECRRLKPDVVLVASVDSHAGLLAARVQSVSMHTRLVVLSERRRPAVNGRWTGAALVPNTADAKDLKRAIWAAVQRFSVDPAGRSGARPRDGASQVTGLTARQLQVLALLASGRSMKEVAALLHVTPRTVAFHKYRMMEQLHVESTAELVQFAVRHGVVNR